MKAIRDSWRSRVYADANIGNATRVLLLWLGENGMRDDGYVSVPQSRIKVALNISQARISERLADAMAAELLDRVQRGAPGRTATYRAVLPSGRPVARARRHRLGGLVETRESSGPGEVISSGRAEPNTSGPPSDVLVPDVRNRPRSEHFPTSVVPTTTSTPTDSDEAQAAAAAKRPSTPDTSGFHSSRSARSGDPAGTATAHDPLARDADAVLPDGNPSLAMGRQHEATQPEDYRAAHDVLAALAPERYQAVLARAREAHPDFDVPRLMLAAAELVRGAA